MSGTVINHRFEIQDIISQAKYASVYKTLDKKKQKILAIKLVSFIFV